MQHPDFPARRLFEAELSIFKRLAQMDTHVVVFASRFTFMLDNKPQVYIRGIESRRCTGTLALLAEHASIPTTIESLATQDLISTLKPIEIARQQGLRDLLAHFKFKELDKLSKCDTSVSFEFACVALHWKSKGTPEIMMVGDPQQANRNFCKLLQSCLNKNYHSLSSNLDSVKRLGLCDIPFDSADNIPLTVQVQIMNCLPAILAVPGMNVSHKFSKPMLCHRQSLRYCALIGTTASDFQVILDKFKASPTLKQPKSQRIAPPPDESYSFPDLPASDVTRLPQSLSTVAVAPLSSHTSVATNFFEQFLSKGIIRCVECSVDKLVFLSNGK
jgi:hypothetical protein